MNATASKTRTRRAPRQAAPDAPILGLHRVADAIGEITGRRPDASTVWHWLTHGVRGYVMRGTRQGRFWITTREAVETFLRESGAIGGDA